LEIWRFLFAGDFGNLDFLETGFLQPSVKLSFAEAWPAIAQVFGDFSLGVLEQIENHYPAAGAEDFVGGGDGLFWVLSVVEGLAKQGEVDGLGADRRRLNVALAELDVSQGTVRKALNDMVTENLLYRRQGLGTFVSEHTERRALFLYFSIVGNDGSRILPESNILSCEEKVPTPEEAEKLQLSQGEMIVQFRRIRYFNDVATIVETISLPLEHFLGFGTDVEPPNNLFRFYQSAYGVTVAKAEEHLKAVSASEEESKLLNVEIGAPMLEIDRIAKMLDGRPVEWRVSHCDTSNYRYVTERG
jgi:GntR family transcriptional regulator